MHGISEPACSVCGSQSADRPLIRCYNPRCRQWLCDRHALSFELHDEQATHLEQFCSRQCYGEVQRQLLPLTREGMFVLMAAAIIVPLYLTVVRYFTR